MLWKCSKWKDEKSETKYHEQNFTEWKEWYILESIKTGSNEIMINLKQSRLLTNLSEWKPLQFSFYSLNLWLIDNMTIPYTVNVFIFACIIFREFLKIVWFRGIIFRGIYTSLMILFQFHGTNFRELWTRRKTAKISTTRKLIRLQYIKIYHVVVLREGRVPSKIFRFFVFELGA